jgi:hypothetical protein
MAISVLSPAQNVCTIAFELLQMMDNQFTMGICAQSGLWDDWQGLFGGLDLSTSGDPPSKGNVFRASPLTDRTHSIE